jgi:hypothetical protein
MSVSAPAIGFSFGNVFSDSFGVLGRNFGKFFLLAVLFTIPSQLYSQYIAQPSMVASGGFNVHFVISILVGLLMGGILTVSLVYGTVRDLQGRPADFAALLARGLQQVGPALAVIIVTTIIFIVGGILLIVPGIIAYVILWVTLPVAVIERPGVTASLSRSAELTKGHRWEIFGILVVLVVAQIVLVFLIGLIFGGILMAAGGGGGGSLILFIISTLFTAVLTAIGSVMPAVGYYRLKVEKEGGDIQQIAAVFD